MKKVIQSTMMACFALICMCLASCNDEAIVDMSQSDEMGQPFRLTATQETPSRLALGQDGLSVTWEPGDKLVLVKKDRSIVPIYMNAELDAPAASATFVSETGVSAGEYYVFYNYNADLAYTHQGFMSINDINESDKLVLWGELTVVNGTSTATIMLKHLYAKVRVELQNVPFLYNDGSGGHRIGMYASKSGFPIYKQFTSTGIIDADYDYTNYNRGFKASRRRLHNITLGYYNLNFSADGEYNSNEKAEIEKNSALILPVDVSDGTLYFYVLVGEDCYEIAKSNVKFDAGKSYKVVLDMATATKTTLRGIDGNFVLGYSEHDSYYQLTSPEECRHAAYRDDSWGHYILMNDIDFQNHTFLPFAARSIMGNGKTLSNISIDWSDEDYVSVVRNDDDNLSGHICSFMNLTLDNVQIKGHSYVGALSHTNVKADNCKIKGNSSIIGQGDHVGGLAGYNEFDGDSFGLLSISNSSIESCEIKGDNYVGGLVGKYTCRRGGHQIPLHSSLRLLNSCSSAAKVDATGDYVGGIFGKIGDGNDNVYFGSEDYTLSLYECINIGEVTGKDYVGGIGGSFDLDDYSSVKDKIVIMKSCNEGDVSGNSYVGGIVGENRADINLCYSIGDISATTTDVGGIIGHKSYADLYVSNCYSMANLAVGQNGYAGGIVGYAVAGASPDMYVENCYFAGTNAKGFGIVGYSDGNTTITNCLTTLPNLIDTSNGQPSNSSGSLTGVTSILNNLSVINVDNAYSNNVWANYNYDCVKFAEGLTGSVTAPGFGTEIIY